MGNQLQLEVVTPQKIFVETVADSVTLPGSEGELGVLPEHIPLLTSLKSGQLTYQNGNQSHSLAVHWGYAQVEGNRVTVLAQVAETAEEIDLDRAKVAERKANEMLSQLIQEHSTDDDAQQRWNKYEAKLKRAIVRQQIAHKK